MDININAMTAPVAPESDDYIKDGILYCGKCHTPKQYHLKNRLVDMIVPCLCDCQRAAQSAEAAADVERRRAEAVIRNRLAGIPPYMRDWTFENDEGKNPVVIAKAKDYCDKFNPRSGAGLLMYGEPSQGKSYAAACIANRLIDRGYRVYVTSFARLSNVTYGMREDKQEFIDGLRDYDLIVIDDLGAERDTSTMYETVHNVIESLTGKCLVVTSNLSKKDLTHPSGTAAKRVIERIWYACEPYEVKGYNWRLQALLEREAANG